MSSYKYLLGRLSLFIIYAWFGILKLIGLSPANPLVGTLQQKIPLVNLLSFEQFIFIFALFEVLIGLLFLMPKFLKLATLLFLIHMAMTVMPLFLLPEIAWQKFLVPTLEGQYIIKNIALLSVVVFLLSKGRSYSSSSYSS
jgi:uncharacterized membrane protein YkgB